ncbi:MAG: hypothetical protein U5K69_14930 [Balneolaceae bacterium]|nr:hypothetical protein [Balneolaceae bacterium]
MCVDPAFFLLIKIALYSYQVYHLNGWLSLGLGALAALTVLLICGFYLVYRLSGRRKVLPLVLRVATALVIAYCTYSLLYLSSVNSKSEGVRSHYRSLHPILRVTLSTVTLADSDLVITDMQRTRADYRRMGLPPRQQSLHYIQSTGYVHAVDVRTKGRSEWKNWLTEMVFKSLGYHTLRHAGTADHLHVALPLND